MTKAVDYRQVISDSESLRLFLEALADFDRSFCNLVMTGDDFTIKLEVHGCKGQLIHIRTSVDGFKRPPGVDHQVEKKGRVGKSS